MTAGFSLGEISSLAYAGAYTAEEGFRIVCRRAEFMAHAAAENPAYMAAVVKLSAEKIEELASKFSRTYPVNYNSAEQTVIYFVVNRFQNAKMKTLVTAIDPNAFITIAEVSDVLGRSVQK